MTAAIAARVIPQRQTCPECDGSGEVLASTPVQNYWGVWEADMATCSTCTGSGGLPNDALVCEVCREAFPADDQACDHGMTLCGDDRGECQVCADEIGHEYGCDDPWGDS